MLFKFASYIFSGLSWFQVVVKEEIAFKIFHLMFIPWRLLTVKCTRRFALSKSHLNSRRKLNCFALSLSLSQWLRVCVRESVCERVCEREWVRVWMTVCVRESECERVCERERVSVNDCVCEREWMWERMCVKQIVNRLGERECVRVKAYMFVNVRVRVYANQKNNNETHTHTIFFEKLPQGMVAAVVRTS